jgi:hypothetical protein
MVARDRVAASDGSVSPNRSAWENRLRALGLRVVGALGARPQQVGPRHAPRVDLGHVGDQVLGVGEVLGVGVHGQLPVVGRQRELDAGHGQRALRRASGAAEQVGDGQHCVLLVR